MSEYIPEVILIPVGKSRVTVVDAIDADLQSFRWHSSSAESNVYVHREPLRKELPEGLRHRRLYIVMHRLIIERMLGRHLKTGEVVDHIDGNGLNNRRENLRVASVTQNTHNSRKQKDNTSGFKGVHWSKSAGKWRALIGGTRKHLGYFDTPEAAHEAYCRAAVEHYGEFARFE